MPRYFFHIKDGVDMPDHVGTELPDDEASRIEAIKSSSTMIKEMGLNFYNSGKWTMTVMVEDRVVWTIHYSGTISP